MVQHRLIHAVAVLLLLADAALAAQSGSMRPGITRRVLSGTTDTATYADLDGQVSWQSAVASPKTQTLPACDNTIDGLRIGVVDGQGTAASFPITVNAASGSVGNASAGVPITGNSMGAIFACDGATNNWAVAGLLPSAGGIVWPNVPNAESTCTPAKSGSSFTPSCAVNNIVLDAAGETINLPSNMPGSGAMATYTLDITGGFVPGFATGTEWPGLTAPVACSGTVTTNCWSATSGRHDRLVGQSLDAGHILYGSVITNYGPPSVRVQGAVGGICGASTTTCSVTFANPITVGNMVACGVIYQSTANVLSQVWDGTNNFTLQDVIVNAGGTGVITGHTAFLLNEVTSGKTTITMTLSTAKPNLQILCDELLPTPLHALDNHEIASQTSPSGPNTVTSGGTATILAGDTLWGVTMNQSGSITVNAGSGFALSTADPVAGHWNLTSELWIGSSSAGTQAAWFTPGSNSVPWITGKLAFR